MIDCYYLITDDAVHYISQWLLHMGSEVSGFGIRNSWIYPEQLLVCFYLRNTVNDPTNHCLFNFGGAGKLRCVG